MINPLFKHSLGVILLVTAAFFLSFTRIATAQHIINAGHEGDYYHNADSLHTNLANPSTDHPGLTIMTPTRGAVTSVYTDKVVVGNASLAYHHPWVGKVALVTIQRYWFAKSQYHASVAYNQYRNNNAYWYVEHQCHDSRDNLHTQTAAVSNSQGSSTSEMDEVKKFLFTLAAFRSDTKQKLKQHGLLMPTIQMISRRTRVSSDNDYLTGKAHPNAFDDFNNGPAMEQMAAEMPPSTVPPMIQLQVVTDTFTGTRGVDIFQSSITQRLYDTPVSISRIWKNRNYTNRIMVNASESFDANGLPLTYHWVVLRGNPAHVRINPQNTEGSIVEIEVDYHPETVIPGSTRLTNLVSVGAFVHNGHYYSAPGFVTSYTLPSEQRSYDTESGRLLETSYQTRPVLQLLPEIDGVPQGWSKDVFHYNNQGQLNGWTRFKGEDRYDFTPEGYQIIVKNNQNEPELVQNVYYTSEWVDSIPRGKWVLTGDPFLYEGGGKDTVSPTTPTNLNATTITKSSFQLGWQPSSDNIAVAGYFLDVAENNDFTTILPAYNNLNIGNATATFTQGLMAGRSYYAVFLRIVVH